MLFEKKYPVLEVDSGPINGDAVLGNFVFNWNTDSFVMQDGSPVVVKGADAVKEWLNYVVRTRQGRLAIYPSDFGASAYEMIGKKIPKGYKLSEFKRMLEETVRYCNGIQSVSGFDYDGEKISFTVTLTEGEEESVEFRY